MTKAFGRPPRSGDRWARSMPLTIDLRDDPTISVLPTSAQRTDVQPARAWPAAAARIAGAPATGAGQLPRPRTRSNIDCGAYEFPWIFRMSYRNVIAPFGLALIAFLLLSTGTATAQITGAPQYAVLDLGTLGGSESRAFGINESGQVVGTSTRADGRSHAFMWADGVLTDLGTRPGDTLSGAYAINDAGLVVGYSAHLPGAFVAVIWGPDGPTNLGRVGQCNCPEYVTAYAINNAGVVAGQSQRVYVGDVAFAWIDGRVIPLAGTGTGEDSGAFGINDSGQVAGAVNGLPALWTDGVITLLPTLGGATGTARAVTPWGTVVGTAQTDPQVYAARHAFYWDRDTGMANLGTLGGPQSVANAIAANVIVGDSTLPDGTTHAFMYDLNGPGEPVDLNDLIDGSCGCTVTSAAAVNSSGVIAGSGVAGSEVHAFILIPIVTDESADRR